MSFCSTWIWTGSLSRRGNARSRKSFPIVGVRTSFQTLVGAKNEARFSGRVPHVRPSVHGPKTDFSNAFTQCTRILALGRGLFPCVTKALEGAAPVFFGPCTLRRTWGTRPEKRASFFAPTSTPATDQREQPQKRDCPKPCGGKVGRSETGTFKGGCRLVRAA
jgi:hypothetical protein